MLQVENKLTCIQNKIYIHISSILLTLTHSHREEHIPRIKQLIPSAEVPEAGHLLHMEKLEQFLVALTDFIGVQTSNLNLTEIVVRMCSAAPPTFYVTVKMCHTSLAPIRPLCVDLGVQAESTEGRAF